jgi:hypothetical protein
VNAPANIRTWQGGRWNVGRGELASCMGKEAYSSPTVAKKVAKRRRRKHRRLSVYRCDYCRKFHMGEILKGMR